MIRQTLMDQVVTEFLNEHADLRDIETFCATNTSAVDMCKLAKHHGLKIERYSHSFHLYKFLPYIDENGEEDAIHIQHDFYF